jgi:hypothetical protein
VQPFGRRASAQQVLRDCPNFWRNAAWSPLRDPLGAWVPEPHCEMPFRYAGITRQSDHNTRKSV